MGSVLNIFRRKMGLVMVGGWGMRERVELRKMPMLSFGNWVEEQALEDIKSFVLHERSLSDCWKLRVEIASRKQDVYMFANIIIIFGFQGY